MPPATNGAMNGTTNGAGHHKVVNTTLNYYLAPELGGHASFTTGIASYYRRKFDERDVKITDIRGQLDRFSLKEQGFQYGRYPTVEKTFDDTDRIKSVVYPETEKLLKEVTGATKVFVFSHILRNDSRDKVEKAVKDDPSLADDNAPVKDVTPARYIHIDQSYDGAVEVLNDNVHPPELAEKLSKTRWAIINVWRPIHPVLRDPLAFCDARTARDEDLIEVPVYFPPKTTNQRYATLTDGEKFVLWYLKYQPEQTWYYCDGMEPGECLFIKCFDTIKDGTTARRVPHSAFVDPTSTDDTKRESIEIRCLVFYEDQPVDG